MDLLLLDLLQDLVFVSFADLALTVALDFFVLRLGAEVSGVIFTALADVLLFNFILVDELLIEYLTHFTLLLKFLLFFKFTGSLEFSLGIEHMRVGFLKEFSLFFNLLLMTGQGLGHYSLDPGVVIVDH